MRISALWTIAALLAVGSAFAQLPQDPLVLGDDESARSDRVSVLIISTRDALGIEEDINRLQGIFDQAADSLKDAGVQIRFERPVIQKDVVSRNELFNLLQNVVVKDRTTLVCYCKLHGGIDKDGRHILYLDDNARTAVPRNDLVLELKKLGAPLTILLTDSCASLSVRPTAGAVQAATFPRQLFVDLFIESRGFVDINSASPTIGRQEVYQRAWMDREGALFTRVFARLLSSSSDEEIRQLYTTLDRNGNHRFSWAEFFPVLSDGTDKLFQQFREDAIAAKVTPDGLQVPADNLEQLKQQYHQSPFVFSQLPTNP